MYDSKYMTLWNRPNYRDRKKSMLVSGWGVGGRMSVWNTQDSKSTENTLYDAITMETWYYMFVKPIKCTT